MVFSFYNKVAAQLSLLSSKKYFWWIALGLLLLPLIVLVFYNHPSADDYCYVVASMNKGFWGSQVSTYVNWSGRYISSMLLGGGPLLFYSFIGYKVINFLLLIFTAVSCLYFVKTILNKKNFDLPVVAISVCLLFLYLSKMPTLTEGFYWLSGALTYQLPNIGLLTAVTLLVSMRQNYSVVKLIAVGALSIGICGGNETSMLEFIYVQIAMMAFEYATTRKIPKYYYAILFLSIAAGTVAVIAPGNAVRGSFFHGEKNLVKAFLLALESALPRLLEWLPEVLMALVLFIPFLKQVEVSSTDDRKITPIVLVLYPLFLIGILILGFMPAFWSVGFEPPPRTINVMYWVFLFSSLFYAVLLILYIKQKNGEVLIIPTYVQWILVFLLLRSLVPHNNLRTASMDIISGRAMIYDREMKTRYEEMDKKKGSDVLFKPLAIKPKSIFFADIEPGHPEDWKNMCTADYFYLKSLDLTKPVE